MKEGIKLLLPTEAAVGLSWTYEQKNGVEQPTPLA